MNTLVYISLGLMDYRQAEALQHRIVALKQAGAEPDFLLFVEHPHVYTLGRSGKEANVLASGDVPVCRTARGGDVTYHGPGQMVVYPILDLRSKLRKAVHKYLYNLEQGAIATLNDFGIRAGRRPPYTGIWIADRKIAAIGVAVKRGVTFHGLALNVNTDLSYFDGIIPCGLEWSGVTSMAKELGEEQSLEQVQQTFFHHFTSVFSYSDVKRIEGRELTFECAEGRVRPKPGGGNCDSLSSILDPRS